eukprot:TRINITY_DN3056_c0_g1_i1.p2 TRINITY_DN3056_c0_g1~~TRINITY_DN3056_c0_g1_i1.p2  ORF type:complete len:144 (-),score=4.37 TRINITY_DN3056_c0_g1_i1:551-982(-)
MECLGNRASGSTSPGARNIVLNFVNRSRTRASTLLSICALASILSKCASKFSPLSIHSSMVAGPSASPCPSLPTLRICLRHAQSALPALPHPPCTLLPPPAISLSLAFLERAHLFPPTLSLSPLVLLVDTLSPPAVPHLPLPA